MEANPNMPHTFEIPLAPEQEIPAPNVSQTGILARYPRDEEWYLEDGDFVILVEGHLFKVSKERLKHASEFFKTMFKEAPDGTKTELRGHSDENPYHLADTTAPNFRALCWVLYIRLDEARVQQSWGGADVLKISRSLAVSFRFKFLDFQLWALDILDKLSAVDPGRFFNVLAPSKLVGHTLNYAGRCGKAGLVHRIEQEWLSYIACKGTSEGDSLRSFEDALDYVEGKGGSCSFHGEIYYAYLRGIGAFGAQAREGYGMIGVAEVVPPDRGHLSQIKPYRRERLFRGYFSLMQLRLRLSQAPGIKNLRCTGSHEATCVPIWRNWYQTVLVGMLQSGKSPNDPGEIIKEVRTKLTSSPIYDQVNCFNYIFDQIWAMERKFRESLTSHFLGSPETGLSARE